MSYLEMESSNFAGPHGIVNKIADFMRGTEVDSESIGAGDGTTLTFSGTLANSPVPRNRLSISYVIGGTTYAATDDCAGYITGDYIDGSSSFNYSTGAYAITFTTAPDNSTSISADYIYGNPGQDYKLLRYSYSHEGAGLDGLNNVGGTETVTLLRATDDGNTADGVETSFYIAQVAPDTYYPNSCITPFAYRITYTIGGVTYTADGHEVQDGLHGDGSGPDCKLIGDTTLAATSGQFWGDSNISASSVSWDTDRGITVTFATAPDDATTVTVNLCRGYSKTSGWMETILQSYGETGLDEFTFGLRQNGPSQTIPYSWTYVYGWYEYDTDVENTSGHLYSEGISRNPGHPLFRSWIQDVVLNLYTTQDNVVGVIETQAGYFQSFHSGMLLRPCSPEYYPNPLFVSGDQFDPTVTHTDLIERHTVFFNTQNINDGYGRRWVCNPGNVWLSPDEQERICSSGLHGDDAQGSMIGPMANGSTVPFPIHLWTGSGMDVPTFLGTFRNVFKVYGSSLAPYDLLDDGAGSSFRVFPDVARSGWKNFWCVRRDS